MNIVMRFDCASNKTCAIYFFYDGISFIHASGISLLNLTPASVTTHAGWPYGRRYVKGDIVLSQALPSVPDRSSEPMKKVGNERQAGSHLNEAKNRRDRCGGNPHS